LLLIIVITSSLQILQCTGKIPEERIKLAKEKLFDHTLHNLNHERMVDVIPFVTIVNEVERIILNEK